MEKRLKSILLITFIIISICAYSQVEFPVIKNFTEEDYHAYPQNWDVVQGDNGFIYVANINGLLQYDGVNWKTIANSEETMIRSLLQSNDTIFAGCFGEFGMFITDKEGVNHYECLSKNVKDEINNVWSVYKIDETIYYVLSDCMYLYDKDGLKKIDHRQSWYIGMGVVNGVLETTSENGEIFRLINNEKWEKVLDLGLGINENGLAIFETKGKKFILYQAKGFYDVEEKRFTDELAIQEILQEFKPYNLFIEKNRIIINTLYGGVLVLDEDLNLKQWLSTESGLQNRTVWGVGFDDQFNLWMALDNGISFANLNDPIAHYPNSLGYDGMIMDIEFYQEKIFLATTLGVFYADWKKGVVPYFNRLESLKSQAWSLEKYQDKLIIATSTGTWVLKDDLREITDNVCYSILVSNDSLSLFIGKINGLYELDLLNNKERKLIDEVCQVRSIVQKENVLWCGTTSKGVIKVNLENEDYDVCLDTLGLTGKEIDVFELEDKVMFNSDNGLMISKMDSFLLSESMPVKYASDTGIVFRWSQFNDSIGGIYWEGNEQKDISFLSKVNNRWINTNTNVGSVPSGIIFAFEKELLSNGYMFGGVSGLYALKSNEKIKEVSPFIRSFVTEVYFDKDSTNSSFDNDIELDYEYNNFKVMYGANLFSKNKLKYQYQLEGFDKEWSDWTPINEKEYTNLFEGNYVFKIKAKSDDGMQTSIYRLKMTVNPPWFRTNFAYLMYLLSFLSLLIIVSKLSRRRLIKAKSELERIVGERTLEIAQKKEQLEELVSDVTDSINYAQLIQVALLASKETLTKTFKKNAILFKPKDIVSGDFYWVNEVEGFKIIIEGDCTGHGVPGAFMSLMGMNFLNEIILEKKVVSPAKVLKELNNKIHKAFHSNENLSSSDGMDLSIIVVDVFKNKAMYAAAQQKVLLYRNNSLEILAHDKMPIGGRAKENFEYSEYGIELQEGDVLIMFSDGFQDQFGGPRSKKIGSKRLRELIQKEAGESENLELKLEQFFTDWKGDLSQVDDVVVIAIEPLS